MFQDKDKIINETDLHIWNQYVRGDFIISKKNLVKKKVNNNQLNSLNQKVQKNNNKLHINKNIYFSDNKTLKKIKKYRIKPDKILDLHGKNKYEGKTSVIKFIRDSYITNKRFLLIITGKGSSSSLNNSFLEQKPGILRRNFPEWLKNDTISSYILNYTSAHNHNGGIGAYYVFLKKNKNL